MNENVNLEVPSDGNLKRYNKKVVRFSDKSKLENYEIEIGSWKFGVSKFDKSEVGNLYTNMFENIFMVLENRKSENKTKNCKINVRVLESSKNAVRDWGYRKSEIVVS